MEATMLLTIVSFLFLSFTSKLGQCASHDIYSPPAVVLDQAGNKLRKGEYYVLVPWPTAPLSPNITLTISPLINRNGTCWVQYKVEDSETALSLPVKFSPIKRNDDEFIRESTLIDIKFNEAAVSYVCGGSSVWRVGDHLDQVFGQRFVTVGGSGKARTTRFIIKKPSPIWPEYNLLSCPGVGDLESLRSSDCLNVGVRLDDDRSGRLALADRPAPFGFKLYRSPSQFIEMKV